MKPLFRHTLMAGMLALCVTGLSVEAQTASPGPGSRNVNVDREDPNKPDTPEHEIPAQEAPGSGNRDEPGAAGTTTPTGGDGSDATQNRNPTQHTQSPQDSMTSEKASNKQKHNCDKLTGAEKEKCEQEASTQPGNMGQQSGTSGQQPGTEGQQSDTTGQSGGSNQQSGSTGQQSDTMSQQPGTAGQQSDSMGQKQQ